MQSSYLGGYFVSGLLLLFLLLLFLLSTQNMKVSIEGCLPLLPFLTMSSPFVVNNSHVLRSLWIIYSCIDEVFSSILLFCQNLPNTCYHVGYCWRCGGTLFSEVLPDTHKRPLNHIPSWSFLRYINKACASRSPAQKEPLSSNLITRFIG